MSVRAEEERVRGLIFWLYDHKSPKGEELHLKWIAEQESRDHLYLGVCRDLHTEYAKYCDG